MKKILLLFFGLACCWSGLYAQSQAVSGTVTSAEDNESIPGVNVVVKGTATGTTTDIDGTYTINVPDGGTLTFTFIGFQTQEVIVGSRSVVDVTLSPDVKQLSEVIVTALGIEREERSLGYAVQEVQGAELEQAGQTNVVGSLAGKIAGVQVGSNTGALGGSSRILIRGANSVAGDNQPLFVVDGVPIDNSNFNTAGQARGTSGYDYGNAAQDINPKDIESMTVLKGASAAALYGTRAANGVILITTKKGSKRDGIGIDINSSLSYQTPLVMPNYQNDYGGGYGPFGRNAQGQNVVGFSVDQSWGPRLDGRPTRQWYSYYEDHPNFGQETPWNAHPDNVNDFYQTGVNWNNSIALSGGNDDATYRMSYTNLDQKGIMPNSQFNRNTLNFNGSLKMSERLSSSIGINYVNSRADGRPEQGYGDVIVQFNHFGQRQLSDAEQRNYFVPGSGEQRSWNRRSEANANPLYADNPYWIRNRNNQNDGRDRIFGNATLAYKFADNLTLTGRYLTDFYTDRRENRVAVGSVGQSLYQESIRQFTENNTELILRFDDNLSDDFSLNALVGGNIRYNKFNENTGTTVGGLSVPEFYSLENSNDRPTLVDQTRERQINSLFAQATVGYRDIAYVDASLRNDWSSTLPEGNNSYLYPSVSGTFIFSALGNLAESEIFSFGKIRANWAQVGNDTDPYRLQTTYTPFDNFGSNPIYRLPAVQNNPALLPERTTSYEVGAELRFLRDRVGLDVTYYNNSSVDQILDVPVSRASGYTALIFNAGEIVNEGVEARVFGTPVVTNDFQWDIMVNWAHNDNQVVSLAPGVENYQLSIDLFGNLGVYAAAGERYGTLLGTDFVYDDNGNKVVGSNGNYLFSENQVPLGSVLADWTGGIRNSFTYKGVNLSVQIDGQKGGVLHSTTNLFGKYSGMMQETVDGNIRQLGLIAEGVTEGGEPNTQVADPATFFSQHFGLAGAHVYDASFVKLRELSLGYTLPTSWISRSPFTRVSVAFQGRDLLMLYKKVPHIDPEAVTNSGNVQGLEGGALPSLRSYGFNVNLSL